MVFLHFYSVSLCLCGSFDLVRQVRLELRNPLLKRQVP